MINQKGEIEMKNLMILLFCLQAMLLGSLVQADDSKHYKVCLECHKKIKLENKIIKKTKEIGKKSLDCLKPGDQGCMEKATAVFGGFIGGTKEFFQKSWEKSKSIPSPPQDWGGYFLILFSKAKYNTP